jgi:hypothetical protein
MVVKDVLSLQPVGEKISSIFVFCIMYIMLCIYLSLRCISMCMFAGYLLCMEYCSFLGWFSMFLLISCVESMFLYPREWNKNS